MPSPQRKKGGTHAQRPPVDPAWHRQKPKADLGLQQQYLVEALPKVGHTLAQRLLERFGSPMGLFSASEDELREVQGIGPTLASQIRRVVQGERT